MDKLISVIIPVYNTQKYLERCLDSIINQTYKNLEIIIIDDGSTDDSPEICDRYQHSDNRIKVIHKKNEGVSKARNLGISISTGEFLAFVDSDDYIDLRMFETLIKNQKKYNADVSICDFISTGNDNEPSVISSGTPQVMNSEEAIFRLYNDKDITFVCLWCKIIKRELFEGIVLPSIKRSEDNFVLYKILYKAKAVVFDESRLYKYFQRDESTVHTFDETCKYDFLAFDEQMTFWESEKKPVLLRECFIRTFKRLIMILDCSENARKCDNFYDIVLETYYQTMKKHIKNVCIGSIEKRLYLLNWRDYRKHKAALTYIRIKTKLRSLFDRK